MLSVLWDQAWGYLEGQTMRMDGVPVVGHTGPCSCVVWYMYLSIRHVRAVTQVKNVRPVIHVQRTVFASRRGSCAGC